MKFRGFTLIELLMAIAVIGILAGVVLAALNTSRVKAVDAATKSDLDSLRTQASIYYNSNVGPGAGGYSVAGAANPIATGGVSASANCSTASGGLGLNTYFADPNVIAAIAGADVSAGGTGGALPTKVQCQIVAGVLGAYIDVNDANATFWTVWAPLTKGTSGWCVDSAGKSEVSASPPATITAGSTSAGCP